MGEKSAISWADATFNPWWGCTKVGPGCDACYAEAWDRRTGGAHWGAGAPRRFFGDKHWNEPRKWNRKAEAYGRRCRVFCASMADVFDNEVDQVHRERLWVLIRETPWLDWQLVTKRIGNAGKMLPLDWAQGYANVWMIATMVNQAEVDRDMDKLLALPARIRGLSIEPMLGPIVLPAEALHCWVCGYTRADMQRQGDHHLCRGRGPLLHWAIVGGESKQPAHDARPMKEHWATGLLEQCLKTSIAFHFKQAGRWLAEEWASPTRDPDGKDPKGWPGYLRVQEFPA